MRGAISVSSIRDGAVHNGGGGGSFANVGLTTGLILNFIAHQFCLEAQYMCI